MNMQKNILLGDNPYLNLGSSTFTRTKNTSEDDNNDNGNDNRDLKEVM